MDERNDMVHLLPGLGEHLLGPFGPLTIKAVADRNGGRFALWEWVIAPGSGDWPHVHTREDELAVVLAGELTVSGGGATRKVSPGSSVYLPRGIAHRLSNEGAEPARVFSMVTPGGLERLFMEMGPAQPSGAADPDGTMLQVDRARFEGIAEVTYHITPMSDERFASGNRPGGPLAAPAPDGRRITFIAPDEDATLERCDDSMVVRPLLYGKQTAGLYTLNEFALMEGHDTPPRGLRVNEAYYVVEGEVTFVVAGKNLPGPTGTFLYAPRNVACGYRTAKSAVAQLLAFEFYPS